MKALAGVTLAAAGACLVSPSIRATFAAHYWLCALGALVLVALVNSFSEWRGGVASILNHDTARTHIPNVANEVDTYSQLYGTDSRTGGQQHNKLLETRTKLYTEMVNKFYNLVTDFYEYGWGESFHFAPRVKCESFHDSLRRHEYYLGLRLGLRPGMKCADLGCGVGGPMRSIARFTGASITGINNNDYQIAVGTRYNVRDGLDHLCTMQKCDFMKLPFEDGHFDACYQVEATCHAPDKKACYSEVLRIVKPGGYFTGYEWVMTPQYSASNARHNAIKQGIEVGNGLPDIATIPHVLQALRDAGWQIIESYEMSEGPAFHQNEAPWYKPLEGSFSVTGFRMTYVGRTITHAFVTVLEALGIAPKGSVKVSKLLNDTANDLVEGGRLKIFTPSFYYLARKPGGAADAVSAAAAAARA
jgi:sterol 24-C-methyltransferase